MTGDWKRIDDDTIRIRIDGYDIKITRPSSNKWDVYRGEPAWKDLAREYGLLPERPAPEVVPWWLQIILAPVVWFILPLGIINLVAWLWRLLP